MPKDNPTPKDPQPSQPDKPAQQPNEEPERTRPSTPRYDDRPPAAKPGERSRTGSESAPRFGDTERSDPRRTDVDATSGPASDVESPGASSPSAE
jgi:hypothetical protein